MGTAGINEVAIDSNCVHTKSYRKKKTVSTKCLRKGGVKFNVLTWVVGPVTGVKTLFQTMLCASKVTVHVKDLLHWSNLNWISFSLGRVFYSSSDYLRLDSEEGENATASRGIFGGLSIGWTV